MVRGRHMSEKKHALSFQLNVPLHQGGPSWVSIASHVNTTDSKKHLGTNRSLYHSSSRKGSLKVGGGGTWTNCTGCTVTDTCQ